MFETTEAQRQLLIYWLSVSIAFDVWLAGVLAVRAVRAVGGQWRQGR